MHKRSPMRFAYRLGAEEKEFSDMAIKSDTRKVAGEMVSYRDKIMMIFRNGFIRYQEGSFLHRHEGHVNIIVSFQIKTGNNMFSPSFGTMRVPTGQPLDLENIVLMPLTEITDYFSLTVNLIELNELQAAQQKISQVLPSVNNIVGKMPLIGSVASTAVGVVGDITNLIVALSPEHAVIHENQTFAVDQKHYPNIGMDYLRLGIIDLSEDGAKYENGKCYLDTGEEATRLTLELVTPVV